MVWRSFITGICVAYAVMYAVYHLSGAPDDYRELQWWRETHQQEYLDKVMNDKAKQMGFKVKES